jgi:hypothetical protein
MMLQTDIIRTISEIVGAIVTFLKPFIVPIGEWMVSWVGYLLEFFPTGWDSIPIYFLIFIVMVISAIIVNSKWPGDKPPKGAKKEDEEDFYSEDLEKSESEKEDEDDIEFDESDDFY